MQGWESSTWVGQPRWIRSCWRWIRSCWRYNTDRNPYISIVIDIFIYIYTIIYYLFIYIYIYIQFGDICDWFYCQNGNLYHTAASEWWVTMSMACWQTSWTAWRWESICWIKCSRGIHCTAKGFYLHVTLSEADWTWVNLKHSCRSASLKNCGWNWMVEYHHLRSPQHHLMAPGSGPLKKMFVFVRKGMGPESPCNPRILQGFIWQVGGKVLFAPRLRVRHVLPHLSLLQHEDRTTSHMVSRCRK